MMRDRKVHSLIGLKTMLVMSQISGKATEELWALANGPIRLNTKFYSGCMVNDVRFHIRDRDAVRKTQNCGLLVEEMHKHKSIEFFGFLRRVVELTYIGGYKVILFHCDWFDVGRKLCKLINISLALI